jgi:hypothetical protein
MHNLSVFVKFRGKTMYSVVYVKKTKIVMRNVLFLAPFFSFLTDATRHVDLS